MLSHKRNIVFFFKPVLFFNLLFNILTISCALLVPPLAVSIGLDEQKKRFSKVIKRGYIRRRTNKDY